MRLANWIFARDLMRTHERPVVQTHVRHYLRNGVFLSAEQYLAGEREFFARFSDSAGNPRVSSDFFHHAAQLDLGPLFAIPRPLHWALMTARGLLSADEVAGVEDLPVVCLSAPTVQAALHSQGQESVVAFTHPLVIGLREYNSEIFRSMDTLENVVTTGVVAPLAPVWARISNLLLWLDDPATPMPQTSQEDESGVAGWNAVYFQALFLLLHEYAHFLLGHVRAELDSRRSTSLTRMTGPLPGIPGWRMDSP